jgi:surface antigen
MRSRGAGGRILLYGSILVLTLPIVSESAAARTRHGHWHGAHNAGRHSLHARNARSAYRTAQAGPLQCVPFARNESGIELVGNAWTWWDSAAGVYQRGHNPEPGSVLAFSSNGAMRLGHVAVVSRVINSREIQIEHANWHGGRISRDVPVVDVSENNDWTAVRVALGRPGEFGSIYPTHGFIYDRPDSGRMFASIVPRPAPVPALNPAPRDLRRSEERVPTVVTMTYDEAFEQVAEMPEGASAHHRRHSKHHRLR